jgi:hypothetical protein
MYKKQIQFTYPRKKHDSMTSAHAQATAKASSKTDDPIGTLKALLPDLERKSDAEIQALQNSMSAALMVLLNALTSPFTGPLEEFLGKMQQVAAGSPVQANACVRNPAFYFGQIYAVAELAMMVQQMKVPAAAAGVVLNSSVALAIARKVLERDAITKSDLAASLGKASQNLHPVLLEMEQAGLIRRDEIGHGVVFSPTPLTRVCVQWVEEPASAVASSGRRTVAG